MYHVYVLKSASTSEIYIGLTNDLSRRIHEHFSGYNKATKTIQDWVLVYNEEYATRTLAAKRERFLKRVMGVKFCVIKVSFS